MSLWVTTEAEPAGAYLGRNFSCLPPTLPATHYHLPPPQLPQTPHHHHLPSEQNSTALAPGSTYVSPGASTLPVIGPGISRALTQALCPHFTGKETETRFPQCGKDPEKLSKNSHLL